MKCNPNYFPIISTFIFLLNTHEKNNIKIIYIFFLNDMYCKKNPIFVYIFN